MNDNQMGSLAVGMLLGAAAVWACTRNRRQMRRAAKRFAGGAEHAMEELDKMMSRCSRL